MRELDTDELAELKRLERRVRVKPILIAVPLTVWFWPMFGASAAAGRFPVQPFMIFSMALLGVMTLYWEWQVVYWAGVARKLRKDIELGRAEIEAETAREILPISRMEWIVDGYPSPWRGYPPPELQSGPPNA